MARQKGVKETKPRKNSPSAEEALRRISSKGFVPLETYPGNTELDWRIECEGCGNSKTFKLRLWRKLGCRYCAKKLSIGIRQEILARTNLELIDPKSPTTASLVRCQSCHRKFELNLSHAKRLESITCPFCTGRRLTEDEISLRISNGGFYPPQTLPKTVFEKFRAECKSCGNTSQKTVNAIDAGKGCRFCARNAPIDVEKAKQVFLASGLRPTEPFPTTRKGWKSECLVCGAIVAPFLSSVERGGGCRYCAGKAVEPEDAVRVMVQQGFVPLTDFPGALKPWECRCTTCQKVSTPSYATVNSKKSGCRFCNPAGINLNKPALLYLIEHKEFRAFKFGIGSIGRARVRSHERQGWKVLYTQDFDTGQEALEIEQLLKRWIREEKGLPQYLGKEEMPQRGETETLSSEAIEAREIWEKALSLHKIAQEAPELDGG